MGWSTGSRLLSDIVNDVSILTDDSELKRKLYEILVTHFENYDCDTICELAGEDQEFDEVLLEMGIIQEEEEEDLDEDLRLFSDED